MPLNDIDQTYTVPKGYTRCGFCGTMWFTDKNIECSHCRLMSLKRLLNHILKESGD